MITRTALLSRAQQAAISACCEGLRTLAANHVISSIRTTESLQHSACFSLCNLLPSVQNKDCVVCRRIAASSQQIRVERLAKKRDLRYIACGDAAPQGASLHLPSGLGDLVSTPPWRHPAEATGPRRRCCRNATCPRSLRRSPARMGSGLPRKVSIIDHKHAADRLVKLWAPGDK